MHRHECCWQGRSRAPRTRGGQSVSLVGYARPSRFGCSPHTRGSVEHWNASVDSVPTARWCSPHTRGSVGAALRGFQPVRRSAPRTRGGQSTDHQARNVVRPKCSPHTRGSVGGTSITKPSSSCIHCAPRTRGGQSGVQTSYSRSSLSSQCSPHTRGSVDCVGQSISRMSGVVLPAHAGVSRARRTPTGCPPLKVLPAHAGVSRSASSDWLACRDDAVLPAHAGVSRPSTASSGSRLGRAPRTRGGQSETA